MPYHIIPDKWLIDFTSSRLVVFINVLKESLIYRQESSYSSMNALARLWAAYGAGLATSQHKMNGSSRDDDAGMLVSSRGRIFCERFESCALRKEGATRTCFSSHFQKSHTSSFINSDIISNKRSILSKILEESLIGLIRFPAVVQQKILLIP